MGSILLHQAGICKGKSKAILLTHFETLIYFNHMLINCRMMPFLSARLRLMMLFMALLGTILHAVGAILRLLKAQHRWFVQTQNVRRLTRLVLHSMYSPLNI